MILVKLIKPYGPWQIGAQLPLSNVDAIKFIEEGKAVRADEQEEDVMKRIKRESKEEEE